MRGCEDACGDACGALRASLRTAPRRAQIVGDSLGDAEVAMHVPRGARGLKIAYANRADADVQRYLAAFDAVLTGDQARRPPAARYPPPAARRCGAARRLRAALGRGPQR